MEDTVDVEEREVEADVEIVEECGDVVAVLANVRHHLTIKETVANDKIPVPTFRVIIRVLLTLTKVMTKVTPLNHGATPLNHGATPPL